ncbi:MAG TPA: DUF2341 domain-containing protein [Desulfuromonadaceae bacterium]|jgi:hypothetical protein
MSRKQFRYNTAGNGALRRLGAGASIPLMLLMMALSLLAPVAGHAAGGDIMAPFPVFTNMTTGTREAASSAVDKSGNVIVTGYQNLNNDANDTFYTSKFKADGTGTAWSTTYFKSPGLNRAVAAAIDSNNDVIVTGFAWNATLFKQEVHTIKYSGIDGSILWNATFSGSSISSDYATCITVDSQNNVYVGGYTNAGSAQEDYFVIKYTSNGANTDGSPFWKAIYNNGPVVNKTDKLMAIVAGAGGIAVTGYSSNGTSFDILTLKYDYNGVKLWESRKPAGGVNDAWGEYVKLDSAGNVVMTGFVYNGVNKDIYTAKYNGTTGALIWEQTYNGVANQNDEPGGLYIDSANDSYVTGYTQTLIQGTDIYTVKYHDPPSGTVPQKVWEQTYNSTWNKDDRGVAITGDSARNTYVTGTISDGIHFSTVTLKYGSTGTLYWQKVYNDINVKDEIPVGIGIVNISGAEYPFIAGLAQFSTNYKHDHFAIKFDPGAINPPSGLTVGTITKDGVTGLYSVPLTWTDNTAGVNDGFYVERKLASDGDDKWAAVNVTTPTVGSTITTFTDTGLPENKFYNYRVKTSKGGVFSLYTDPVVQVLTFIVTPIPPVWTYLYNSRNDNDDYVNSIAAGPDNQPVVTGVSRDYAPGYSSGTVSNDFYTAKLNKDTGAEIWSNQFEGGFNQEDDGLGVSVDINNDVVVTGNSMQYSGVPAIGNINSIYTLKYNATAPATIQWHGQYNGATLIDDRARAVATTSDATKNIVVVGYGQKTVNNADIYVVKYAPSPALVSGNAQPLWSATYDGGGNDYPSAVAFDRDGNVFVAGYSETALGSLVYKTFIAKYCGTTGAPSCGGFTQGQIIWKDTYSGFATDNRAYSLAVDNDGNPYVTGYAVNGANGKDFLTIKYDGKQTPATTRILWAKTSDGDAHGNDVAVSIMVDPIDNNAVVGGTVLTGTGNNDFRVIRYSSADGSEIWNKTYPSPSTDESLNSMALDISGNIFAVGNSGNKSMAVEYGYDGTLRGATIYSRPAVNILDQATAVTVNSLGDAFVAGSSRNNHAIPNDDYLVYKMAGLPLQAPYPFTVTPNYTSAVLAWTDNSPAILAADKGFNVERKNGACGPANINPWALVTGSPFAATTFTDTGLTIGNSYCYHVRAFRTSTSEATRWIERSVTLLAPPAPTAFSASATDTTTANLTWTKNTTNESGFQIERCTGASCVFPAPAEPGFTSFIAPANAVSFTDSSACPGVVYKYRIFAYRTYAADGISTSGNAWESAYTYLTTPVSGSITTPGTNVPGTPGITALNESQIKLTWTDTSTDETGYRVYECIAGNCSSLSLAGTTAANATSYIVYGLVASSAHTYVVKAFKTAALSCSGGWESNPTAPLFATTVNNPPVLTATKMSSTRIDLSWTDTTASETGFNLQRCKTGFTCTGAEPDNTNYDLLPLIPADVTSYSDTTACQNITYKYRVRAISEGQIKRRALLSISGFQPNFQTKITITRANFPGMQGNYAGIGFYDDTAQTQLPFWIDQSLTTATSATIWFKTGANNNIYLYYDNSTFTSSSNGSATFEFFDDFDGAALDGKWAKSTTGAATITVGGGLVTFDAPSLANTTVTAATPAPPYRLEARTKVYSTYLGTGLIRVRGMGGVGDTGIYDVGGSKLVAYFNSFNTNIQVLADTYVRWRAAHTGGATNTWSIFNEDETQIYSTTYTGSPSGIYLAAGDGGGGSGKFSLDWIFARKYLATEPVVTSVGAPLDWGSTYINAWNGAWSALASGATDAAAIPTGAVASRVSESEIKITLNYSFADITGIKVDRCTDSTCVSVAKSIYDGPLTATVSDNAGLLPNTTYYYLVHSYKTATCSWDTKDPPIASPVKISAATALIAPVINATATPAVTTTCNDIRFTDSDGSTILNHWLESGCNSASTSAWLKFTSLPAGIKTIYLYYGSPAAAAPAQLDPNTLFNFYDDFAGTTLNTTSKWTKLEYCGGATRITQNNGLLVNSGCGYWGYTGMYTQANFTRPFVVEFSHNHTGANYAMFGAKNTVATTAYTSMPYAIYPIYDVNGNRLAVNEDGVDRGDNKKLIASNIWQYYKLEVLPTGANYYHGDSPTAYTQFYTSSYSSASPLKFGLDVHNQVFTLGAVKVRKYANPQPGFTLLVEQAGTFLTGGAWGVKRQIDISNTTGSALTDYQMPITIDTRSLASDQIGISWTLNTATEERHVIERCTGAACTTTFTVMNTFYGPAAVGAYTDKAVVAGANYCYRVSAERNITAPLWNTGVSGVVCAVTSALPVAPALSVTEHETSMDLSWNDVATGENAYIVQRCKGVACNVNTPDPGWPKTLAPNTTAYQDTTVCNDSYTYAVKAVKYGANAWDTGFSTPLSKATIVPEKPVFTSAARISENQINLVWQDKTGDETGFEIDRCEGSLCDFTTKTTLLAPLSTGVGGIVNYSDTGLKPSTIYRYRVRAYKTGNPCGWPSAYSVDVREATTSVAAPTAISGSASSTTSVNLFWTDTTLSDSVFKVERCVVGGTCSPLMDYTANTRPATNRVFYSFNNTLDDSSGNGLRLTGSTPTYEDGGLALSTATTFQSAVTSILDTDTHAIEFDIKIRATNAGWTKIFGYNPVGSDRSPGIWLRALNSSSLHWRYDPGNTGVNSLGVDGDDNTPFTVGLWYHVRGVKSGGSFKAYVNGALVSDTSVASIKYSGTATLWFGGADVTIKNFSIDWNEGATSIVDNTACSDTAYTYRVKAKNDIPALSSPGAGCWLSRAPLTITNFQPNFLTTVIIPYDTAMLPDYRDLRFVDTTANIELPYWIQKSTATSATIWFKTGANNNISIYYGNSTAIAVSSKDAVFGTGLVGYWPFSEAPGTTGGTTVDWSGSGNDLTLTGFSAPNGIVGSGPYGNADNALKLVGNSYAYRNVATGLPTGSVLSAEAWIKPTGPSLTYDYNGIVAWGLRDCLFHSVALSLGITGNPQVPTWCNDYISPGPKVNFDQWNHYAFTMNGRAITVYVNGVATSGSLDPAKAVPDIRSQDIAIGALELVSGNRNFIGMIGEVRLYNRVLTQSDINARFAATLPSVSVGTKQQTGSGCLQYQYDGPFSAPYTIVTPAVGGNIIPGNADFSNGLTSWTPWGTGVTADSMTFSGTKSLKISALMPAGSQSAYVYQALKSSDVVPGRSYKLMAKIKANLDKTTTSTALAYCRLDSVGGNPDTLGREMHTLATDAWNDNAWHNMTPLDITLKAGITSATVICGIWTADGQNKTHTAYFTGLQLVPNPTINLTATPVSEDQVNLAWSDSITDKTGYTVERCNLATCLDTDFQQVVTGLPASTNSFNDVVPAPGVLYTYRLKAFKTVSGGCGWTVNSNTPSVTPSIAAPAGLVATPVNTTRIDLAWSYASASETGFIVERCTGLTCGGADFQPLTSRAGPGATSFSDTTACNNTTYRYQVKAYKDGLSMGGTQCWTRRKDLTVSNFLPAFQMRYTVTWDSDMKADFSDIRFHDATANIELPYWIESMTNSSTATVWIKTGMSSTIQMYFGNSTAVSVSNPYRVFDFFDDFSGTVIDPAKWTKVDPNNLITQNNELIIASGGPAWGTGFYSTSSFARPFVFEINSFNPTGTTSYSILGLKKAGSVINYPDFVHSFYLSYYNTPTILIFENGTTSLDTGLYLPNDVYKYFRIETLPLGAKFYYGDSISSNTKYYDSTYSSESPLKIGFSNNSRNIRFDNARVRRYAAVEPAVSVTGSKVVLGSCPTFTGQWTSNPSPPSTPVTTPAWSTPSGLTATAINDNQINLAWTRNTTDETGFNIQRCTNSGCSIYAPLGTTGAGITAYSDSPLSASTTYCYQVQAVKSVPGGCGGGWSSGYSTAGCDLVFPAHATNLTANAINSGSVQLAWTDNATDESGYEVEVLAWEGMWVNIATLAANVTTYVHASGLQSAKQYSYRVRPYRGTGKSPYSNVATVTMPAFTKQLTCP